MLLDGLTDLEKEVFIANCQTSRYIAGETIFSTGDPANHLHLLISGQVLICNFHEDGTQKNITIIQQQGDVFGEVFLFVNDHTHEHCAIALEPSQLLRVPRHLLWSHEKVIENLLSIFANKAYFLNQKVQILSCSTLRDKLMLYFTNNQKTDGTVTLPKNREILANYLNVARPSLSRELMSMQQDGLIQVERNYLILLK